MIKNPSFHLNQFIKGASGCQCPGDGVFLIKIDLGVPTLSNLAGEDLGFTTSPYLKRFIKSMGVTLDGIYGFRINNEDVMFENILNCPTAFESSPEAETFFFNTNDCDLLDDGFYGIQVAGCDATYIKIFDDGNCGLSAPTGITSNSYTCGDIQLSWNDVEGATSYRITYGTETLTSNISMVTIPYTTAGTQTYTVTPLGVAGSGPSTSIIVTSVQCAILNLTDNSYVHGDLTLSWDTNETATYYTVSYGGTTTTVTSPTITIPYTVGGSVNYVVSACDGSGCSIGTSISVIMMQSNVANIVNTGYVCDNMTISWDAVVGATTYRVFYSGSFIDTATNSITIPYTTPSSIAYLVTAGNVNGYNTGSSNSFSMTSCGIGGLSSNGYTCGNLTLSWIATVGADNYVLTYSGTSIQTTGTSLLIPFTSNGSVTYTVEARTGISPIDSASITVNMLNCLGFVGNTYSKDATKFYVATLNDPTSFYNNTSVLDDWTQTGEIQGFTGSFNPLWVKQNPYTKKVHYGFSSSVYVGNVGEKLVTLVTGSTATSVPHYTNTGITYWYNNGSMFVGTDSGLGNTSWGAPSLRPFSGSQVPGISINPDGSSIGFVDYGGVTITNGSGVLIRRLIGNTSTSNGGSGTQTWFSNTLIDRDPVTQSYIVGMFQNTGAVGFDIWLGFVRVPLSGSFVNIGGPATPSKMLIQNGKIVFISGTSFSGDPIIDGGIAKPSGYTYLSSMSTSGGAVLNRKDSGLLWSILETDPSNRQYYIAAPLDIRKEVGGGFITVYGMHSNNDGGSGWSPYTGGVHIFTDENLSPPYTRTKAACTISKLGPSSNLYTGTSYGTTLSV